MFDVLLSVIFPAVPSRHVQAIVVVVCVAISVHNSKASMWHSNDRAGKSRLYNKPKSENMVKNKMTESLRKMRNPLSFLPNS